MTEHEELLMLRALAAKQAQELEASKRIIAERDEKIRKQNIRIDNRSRHFFMPEKVIRSHPLRSLRWMVSCRCLNLYRNLQNS